MKDVSRRSVLKGIGLTAGAVAAGAVLPKPSAFGSPTARPTRSSTGSFPVQFNTPDIEARAWFRYWVPDATVSPADVRSDIAAMAAGGFGGFELTCLTPFGLNVTAKNEWGSPAWTALLEAALSEAKVHGMHASALIGPTWPAAVPSITLDSSASSKQLVEGHVTVDSGSTYSGAVPASPTALPSGASRQQLVALLAYRCADAVVPSAGTIPLVHHGYIDLLDQVTGQPGSQAVRWTAPTSGTPWLLIAFWQQPTGQSLDGGHAVVVDHYSLEGANAITRFWDAHLLTAKVRSLLRYVPTSIFEDSIELASGTHWTPGMLSEFKARRGYDLMGYLADLPTVSAGGFGATPTPVFAFTDVNNNRVIHDFDQTLSDLYLHNHTYAIQQWAHQRDMKYKAQAYGGQIDTTLAAATIDFPEGESLDDGQHSQKWRAIAGGAHLGGRNIVSAEADATLNNAYGLTWGEDMLPMSNGNYASGVNRDIIHGYPTYHGPNAVWPGNDGFAGITVGENWGPRMPTWTHIRDMSGYLARCQYVLQLGKPKVDVAVYRPGLDIGYGSSQTGLDVWSDSALEAAGYTYDYQSHGSIELTAAKVVNGVLAPNGPAYRAMILFNQDTLAIDDTRRLIEFSKAGLPIIIIGALPQTTPGWFQHAEADAQLADLISTLVARSNVHRVATEADAPAALASLGILPAAQPSEEQPSLASVRRQTDLGDIYFFANVGGTRIETTLSVEGSGIPYQLNPYSGDITPFGEYRTEGNRVRVPASIASEDSLIIALTTSRRIGVTPPARHAVSSTVPVAAEGRSLVARASTPGSFATELDNGRTVRHHVAQVPDPVALTNWSLSVQEWLPGPTATTTDKRTITLSLDQLSPWQDIDQIADAAGIGIYKTDFLAPTVGGQLVGARLDLGNVCDTFRVWLNGIELAAPDIIDTIVDIGPFLRPGSNSVKVEVATPLLNAVRAARGGMWLNQKRQDYGLIGPVYVRPYIQYVVSAA